MNNPQGTLHLQMLHQTRSKNEEEIEDGDRHEDVQEQQQEEETPNCGPLNGKMIDTHVEESCKKSGYLMSSSKLASKQPAVDHARHGKIVKVHGGHIARKDRHSKVHTSKGPRDRRFRLSAPTAIQFYDVQDRLGCHRPSKAIDWLIEKAKSAIEALSDELPSKEQDIGEQSMHHQGSNGGQETMSNVNPMNNMNRFKEPVFDPLQLCPVNYAEEAFNSASSLSDSKVMEMGWFQSLMGWNYNSAGDGGDSGEAYPFNSSSLHLH